MVRRKMRKQATKSLEAKGTWMSIVTKTVIYDKSALSFYIILLVATSLPIGILMIIFPPLFIDGRVVAFIWKRGLGWNLPWPLLILTVAAPTLIVFLLMTAEKSTQEAQRWLKEASQLPDKIAQPRFLHSPWIELAGIIIAALILLEELWPAVVYGVPIATAQLDPTWPVALCLFLNFLAWWFLAGQFAFYILVLTLFFFFRVRKIEAKLDRGSLDSWIRTDLIGKLKPAATAMLKLFRWFLVIVTLAVVGFWLFKYGLYVIFLSCAVLFPVSSYLVVAYSFNSIVKRSKTNLSRILAENESDQFQRTSYLHYISEIDEWPMPLRTLREPFYAITFWFITSFVIPQLINIVGA